MPSHKNGEAISTTMAQVLMRTGDRKSVTSLVNPPKNAEKCAEKIATERTAVQAQASLGSVENKIAPNSNGNRTRLEDFTLLCELRLKKLCHIECEVSENAVGAGPLEGQEAFKHSLVAVKPPVL